MRHLPCHLGRRFRVAATIVALSGFTLSGCGDDDPGGLFNVPGDAGDASATPDHAADAKGDRGSSDVSVGDRVEPRADVAVDDAPDDTARPEDTATPEDTGVAAPDVAGSDSADAPDADAPDAHAIVDASDTGPGVTESGPDAPDVGTPVDASTDAIEAGTDAASVDAFDAGCDDSDLCTIDAQLPNGTCTHVAVICTALDQCHIVGVCNPGNGQCSQPPKTNDTDCNDNNACTLSDKCQNGACTGTNPIVCAVPDQCHMAGVCDPSNGQCSNPLQPNDTACNDINACTQTDTCQSGICIGASPKTCPASNSCHFAGVCDPSNGNCSDPPRPDDTACNDGDGCTQTDKCVSGICTGGNPIVCTALDQCHDVGTCVAGACPNPNKTNGSGCDDQDLCTQVDTCQNGSCTGANPVVCPAPECHVAGTCDTGTGLCSTPTATIDGSVCTSTIGGRCNVGACLPTFMVVRVGDKSAGLSTAAVPVFVERRYLDSVGAIIDTIPMPVAASGANQILTMSGSGGSPSGANLASTEGALSRSVDGKFVTLAGYAATVGTLSVSTTSAITTTPTNRIVGRIAADGTVDTSTHLTSAFSGSAVRGATSTDGTAFWVAGAGSTYGGIHYTTFGAVGSTQLIPGGTQPTSIRVPQIFGGNLYGTGSATNFVNVFQVGTGLPTTGPLTAVGLPGMPTAVGPSPYSYVFFDTDGTAGFDTLYVADDRAPNLVTPTLGGGIQKWTFIDNPDGGAPLWTLVATFNTGLTTGVRGLAGTKTSTGIALVATTAETVAAPANQILYYIDDGSLNLAPLGVVDTSPVAANPDGGTASPTALFRGVALAP